jgi:hypothetical protein
MTVQQISMAKFLGDIVNEKGSNADMVADKIKKAQAAMANNLAMVNEVTMGVHFVSSAFLLYQSVFLATLLSNAQTWRRLTIANIKAIETVQLRYLKRVMKAPLSTPNAFVLLEYGTLPASAVIHRRQLAYLHHILLLEDSDPFKKSYHNQQQLPFEKNWTNEVLPLMEKYELELDTARLVSRNVWKTSVKKKVEAVAFQTLLDEAATKSKIMRLHYPTLTQQQYLTKYTHPSRHTKLIITSQEGSPRTSREAFDETKKKLPRDVYTRSL